jgi:hypothetical protein
MFNLTIQESTLTPLWHLKYSVLSLAKVGERCGWAVGIGSKYFGVGVFRYGEQ